MSDHFYSDGHEGVVLATQFRTLTVVSAFFTFRYQRPHFIDETRDSVFLATEIRNPERVNHIIRGDQETNFLTRRNDQFVIHFQLVVVVFLGSFFTNQLFRSAIGEQTTGQNRVVVLLRRRGQVGEERHTNIVIVFVGQILVAPLPAVAGDLHRQLGLGAVVNLHQNAGSRHRHGNQNHEGNHGPEHFQEDVFMEGGRIGVLGAAVADHGVHDQAKHQQTNDGHNPENGGVKILNILTDLGHPWSQVEFGTFGPVAGEGHTTDHQ